MRAFEAMTPTFMGTLLVLDGLGHLKVCPKEMEKDCNEMKDKEQLHIRLGRESCELIILL